MNLGALQHEKGFDQVKAWIEAYETATTERGRVNLLLMLKSRKFDHRDDQAAVCLDTLAVRWLDSPLLP